MPGDLDNPFISFPFDEICLKVASRIIKNNTMSQVKYSFDKESLIKMLKGALIAATGAGALYLLNAIGAVQFDNPLVVSLVALLVPTAVNMVKEYMKGSAVAP